MDGKPNAEGRWSSYDLDWDHGQQNLFNRCEINVQKMITKRWLVYYEDDYRPTHNDGDDGDD